MVRRYSDLVQLKTFKERFEYLKLDGIVGQDTFGSNRWLNQNFYRKDKEWMYARDQAVIRDRGFDLGHEDFPIQGNIYVHHLNPITKEDIIYRTEHLLNPEYLISCSFNTHQAITYGLEDMLIKEPVVRTMNDTCPWRK